jgi:hypothetical protein
MNRKLGNALEKALTNLIEQRRKQPVTPCGGVEIPLIGVVAIYNDKGAEDAREAPSPVGTGETGAVASFTAAR